ncbi:dTDP-4-dehydrorhamnose 3,5-epimerase family protein [Oceanibium sediminis]|uniref:dTDP-4-dehydrorhamnose 3,5-epimerase family protein n=1 Tax=Oceanibium sediminis TaxID=2026339 RepID=UPI000DD419A3|nr:dTDP-4-dehydrorhamnose 3,5-epimerase family protein [Oceanibium sediminis]
MKFTPLPLEGAYLVEQERIADDRGYNARVWCAREFREAGLPTDLAQVNVIANKTRGTLRGLHFQHKPFEETKLFRVTRGAMYDVIVDLRPASPTFLQWTSVELRADTGTMLFVPACFGQGFQTLEDDTELTYQVSAPYSPDHGDGFRHDDPLFAIDWPMPPTVISEKDASWPDFNPEVLK